MSNMSYCRFRNTYRDLLDCEENWDDMENISEEERKYRAKILGCCERIIENNRS